MKQILFILISFLLIPYYSYSQSTIQNQNKIVSLNEYQVRQIVKDKVRLNYLEKVNYQDAVLIQELEAQIFIHQQITTDYKELIVIKEETIQKLRTKNTLIVVGSTLVVGSLTYLYITK